MDENHEQQQLFDFSGWAELPRASLPESLDSSPSLDPAPADFGGWKLTEHHGRPSVEEAEDPDFERLVVRRADSPHVFITGPHNHRESVAESAATIRGIVSETMSRVEENTMSNEQEVTINTSSEIDSAEGAVEDASEIDIASNAQFDPESPGARRSEKVALLHKFLLAHSSALVLVDIGDTPPGHGCGMFHQYFADAVDFGRVLYVSVGERRVTLPARRLEVLGSLTHLIVESEEDVPLAVARWIADNRTLLAEIQARLQRRAEYLRDLFVDFKRATDEFLVASRKDRVALFLEDHAMDAAELYMLRENPFYFAANLQRAVGLMHDLHG